MTDDEAFDAFRSYQATGDLKIRNSILEAYGGIATTCARRFRDRGEPLEDLVQVGLLGLLKAVERFDSADGTPFPGFAWPTVNGELRRHFRDTSWAVHVPRRMKEVSSSVAPAEERLRERFGRQPTVEELARDLQVSVNDVIGGLQASAARHPVSLNNGGPGGPERDFGQDDVDLAAADNRVAVAGMMRSLPEREQTILFLRFFEEWTQSEIAVLVGMSQVHVSRLIKTSLSTMRRQHAAKHGVAADSRSAHQ